MVITTKYDPGFKGFALSSNGRFLPIEINFIERIANPGSASQETFYSVRYTGDASVYSFEVLAESQIYGSIEEAQKYIFELAYPDEA